LLRRKSKSDPSRNRLTDGGGWGLYLTFQVWNFESKRLETKPYKASVTPAQAEAIITQDPRLKLGGITFGRWQGDEFQEGQKTFFKDSHDVFFESSDGLHSVRLKCPPLEPLDFRPMPHAPGDGSLASFAARF
jgi:hypothetical protein